jgi:hypothetical protein
MPRYYHHTKVLFDAADDIEARRIANELLPTQEFVESQNNITDELKDATVYVQLLRLNTKAPPDSILLTEEGDE